MKPIIEAKNIGKKYNITHQRGGYVTLRDVLTNIFKNPFSFLKTKTKQIIGLDTKEEFWALKDVNFSIQKGEVIGIIGKNGAGKSTLLKILSQITPPTTGEIKIHGRVGSLLEVGTGFHPELTGRENIFLNGAILGMKKKEIAKKFDEIVKFAGIEKFLDTPVKYYSSGMYVRLAFSVAAHMETDILIIDEVLAVGDAEFQKKCLGKMEEITKENERTILFVSHNMTAIKQLCKKTILLDGGEVKITDTTEKVVDKYLDQTKQILLSPDLLTRTDRKGTGKVRFIKCEVIQTEKDTHEYKLKLQYKNNNNEIYKNAKISVDIYTNDEIHVANLTNTVLNQTINFLPGENTIELSISNFNLVSGTYTLELFLASDAMNSEIFDWIEHALSFEIDNDFFYSTKQLPPVKSLVLLNYTYEQ